MSEPMSDDERLDLIRDLLGGWPIGSGYYQTTVGGDEAREMADAILESFRAVAADEQTEWLKQRKRND